MALNKTKKGEVTETKETDETKSVPPGLSDLPFDALSLIFQHLDLKSLMAVRSTCKTLRTCCDEAVRYSPVPYTTTLRDTPEQTALFRRFCQTGKIPPHQVTVNVVAVGPQQQQQQQQQSQPRRTPAPATPAIDQWLAPRVCSVNLSRLSLSEIPQPFLRRCLDGEFPRLRSLDISCNHLTHIPDAAWQQFGTVTAYDNQIAGHLALDCPDLTHVDLCGNRLARLDVGPQCTQLQHLVVSGNRLAQVDFAADGPGPYALRSLFMNNNIVDRVDLPPLWQASLQVLHLRCNNLTFLDVRPRGFPKLEVLNLSHNRVALMPDLAHMSHLRVLKVDHNRLLSLPELPASLETLTCAHNHLPCMRLELAHLYRLHASYNVIADVDVMACPQLKYVDLSENSLTAMPAMPASIVHVDISNNATLSLGGAAGSVAAQQVLLANNRMAKIDMAVFSRIRVLQMGNNDLAELGHLPPTLTHVNVSYNRITRLPRSACALEHLAILDMQSNRLYELPEGVFDNMPRLYKLYMHNNFLTAVPDMGRLRSLQYCNFSYNPLSRLPPGINALPVLRLALLEHTLIPPSSLPHPIHPAVRLSLL